MDAGGPSIRRFHAGWDLRLIGHYADHCGELSHTLGITYLPQIDLLDSA